MGQLDKDAIQAEFKARLLKSLRAEDTPSGVVNAWVETSVVMGDILDSLSAVTKTDLLTPQAAKRIGLDMDSVRSKFVAAIEAREEALGQAIMSDLVRFLGAGMALPFAQATSATQENLFATVHKASNDLELPPFSRANLPNTGKQVTEDLEGDLQHNLRKTTFETVGPDARTYAELGSLKNFLHAFFYAAFNETQTDLDKRLAAASTALEPDQLSKLRDMLVGVVQAESFRTINTPTNTTLWSQVDEKVREVLLPIARAVAEDLAELAKSPERLQEVIDAASTSDAVGGMPSLEVGHTLRMDILLAVSNENAAQRRPEEVSTGLSVLDRTVRQVFAQFDDSTQVTLDAALEEVRRAGTAPGMSTVTATTIGMALSGTIADLLGTQVGDQRSREQDVNWDNIDPTRLLHGLTHVITQALVAALDENADEQITNTMINNDRPHRNDLRSSVVNQLDPEEDHQLSSAVLGPLRTVISGTMESQLLAVVSQHVSDVMSEEHVRDELRSEAYQTLWFLGGWDAYWLAYYEAARDIAGVRYSENDNRHLNAYIDYAKNCGIAYFYKNVAIICDRPKEIRLDEDNRLHREDGPAIEWPDGYGVYSFEGVRVPAEWIDDTDNALTAEMALTWQNIEQRRVAAKILGYDKILSHLGGKTIDASPDPEIGELIEVQLPDVRGPSRFLRCQCGTGRTFAICVPPDTQTVIEAQAWMIGIDPKDFNKPEIRT